MGVSQIHLKRQVSVALLEIEMENLSLHWLAANIGETSNAMAELWAIREGLILAREINEYHGIAFRN